MTGHNNFADFFRSQECRAEFNNVKELGRHEAMTGYNHFADFFPCAGMPGRIQQRERTGAPRGNDWVQSFCGFFSMRRNAGQNSTT
jgi:hypothetical protein